MASKAGGAASAGWIAKEQIGDQLIVTGENVQLSQADMPFQPTTPPSASTCDVIIYADTITLSGTLSNPGRKIEIVARTVIVESGATLDVSGGIGSPNYAVGDLPQQADQSAGASGVSGATGGQGGPGGTIAIYAASFAPSAGNKNLPPLTLNVAGGPGGTGQTGHDGLPGAAGQWGVTPNWPGYGQGDNGSGGEGGAGGNGGTGGVGGNGGSITVGVVNAVAAAVLRLGTAGGPGGVGGMYGAGGPGGESAPPPPGQFEPREPPAPRWGNPGTNGGLGNSGSATLAPSFTYAELGALMTLPQLSMFHQAADSAFLGKQYVAAGNLYIALMALTAANVKVPSPTSDQEARIAIYQAAQCELSRLKQGLDFFGARADWAPALTLAALQTEIDGLLTLAAQLETSFAILTAQNQSADQKRQTLQDAQNQAATSATDTRAHLAALSAQIQTLEGSLGLQLNEINDQLQAIALLQGDLQHDEFEADHPGCSTMSALSTCGSVIAVGLSVDSGFGEVEAAVSAFAGSESVLDGVKNGISLVQSVEAGYDSIKDGFATVQSAINPATSPDGGKLLTNEQDYDAWIEPLVGKYASAAALKSAADRYFDMVKTRNNNVLDYNALWMTKYRMQAQLAHLNATFEAIAAQLAAANDPNDPAYVAFVAATGTQVRTIALRKIADEIKAFLYWSVGNDGGDSSAPVSVPTDTQLATLQNAHTAVGSAIDSWRDMVDRPFGNFTAIQIPFARAANPDAFAALSAAAKAAAADPSKLSSVKLFVRADVSLTNTIFAAMYHVTAMKVRVRLPDYDATLNAGVLTVNVVHGASGAFMQMDAAGAMKFSHAPRPTLYKYDYRTKASITDGTLGDPNQGFTGLSPFTDWIIELGFGSNTFIDYDTLSSVVLEFDGVFLGPSLTSAAASRVPVRPRPTRRGRYRA